MLLHEAVKKARIDLKLSQKRLSEMAGIQRRQLATLEAGGNITLATLRKVLVHLPNLETFTLDAVTATVRRQVSDEERHQAVEAAMALLGTAVQTLATALAHGQKPGPDAIRDLRRVNEFLYEGMGYSREDLERTRREIAAQRESTEERAAQTVAALLEAAPPEVTEQLIRGGLLRSVEEEEEEEDAAR
ncbi:MAG TPA: helix-turn-helix domain-containing protein [Thermoanaerobaculia bacterium]|nr:helix-turn-helix domain-containing protein [Thermoanaerobaculia bacterium]